MINLKSITPKDYISKGYILQKIYLIVLFFCLWGVLLWINLRLISRIYKFTLNCALQCVLYPAIEGIILIFLEIQQQMWWGGRLFEESIQLTRVYNLFSYFYLFIQFIFLCKLPEWWRKEGNEECQEIFPQERQIRFLLTG